MQQKASSKPKVAIKLKASKSWRKLSKVNLKVVKQKQFKVFKGWIK